MFIYSRSHHYASAIEIHIYIIFASKAGRVCSIDMFLDVGKNVGFCKGFIVK